MAQSAFRVSASIARLIEQFLIFWEWLTGLRDRIVNPIIRTALNVLDQLSVITAQLAAFVAIFLIRVVPWLARLVFVLPAFTNLIRSVAAFLGLLVDDLSKRLHDLTGADSSPLAFLHRIIDMLRMLPAHFKKPLIQAFRQLAQSLEATSNQLQALLDEWLGELKLRLRYEIERTPIVRFFKTAGDTFDAAGKVLTDHFPRIAKLLSGPGVLSKILKAVPPPLPDWSEVEKRTRAFEGPPPPTGAWDEWWNLRRQGLVPDTKTFFDFDRVSTPANLAPPASGELMEGPFSMASDLYSQIRHDLDRQLPDVFAGERKKLRERAGGEPRAALLKMHEGELQYYRDLFGSVLDRMIGASGAGFFALLEPKLDLLDKELNLPAAKAATAPLPVLDVREENRLRVEVPRFRIHYRGPREDTTSDALNAFGDELRALWIGQEYLLPQGG